jgi:hypothetical protein
MPKQFIPRGIYPKVAVHGKFLSITGYMHSTICLPMKGLSAAYEFFIF